VVVVDSTGDLPATLVAGHDLHVIPLAVRFGDERLLDGIDIRPRDFYQRIVEDHPSTEPPTVDELAALYERLLPEQDVVSVHLSAAMSETFAHAVQAAERTRARVSRNRPNPRIEMVDGRGVSLGIGLLALFAARMAARGHGADGIAAQLRGCRDRIHTLFLVDTFDYLVRGKRIGRARAALGKLLGIKPILGVVDGEVAAIDRVRGGRRAHPRIVELVAERVDSARPIVLAVAHAAAPVWADRLKSLLAERFELAEMVLSDIGPVVGTHTGPGCVGCVVFQPTDKEWTEIRPLD
jgi:DegV family protein with EDD domain